MTQHTAAEVAAIADAWKAQRQATNSLIDACRAVLGGHEDVALAQRVVAELERRGARPGDGLGDELLTDAADARELLHRVISPAFM